MDHLKEHSKAKVALYGEYLKKYLNILCNVPFIDQIFLFDLFCGEGMDREGNYGSPLVALEAISKLDHGRCKQINVIFNDMYKSEIDSDKYKVDRIRELSRNFNLPGTTQIRYEKEPFSVIFPSTVQTMKGNLKSRGLFFIDPYRYKEIVNVLEDIKQLINYRNTELILFLPTSFMHRFAESSYYSDAPGNEPIKKFTKTLFKVKPHFEDITDFINQTKDKLKEFLELEYITTFSIQRDPQNVYCLFLITTKIRGFEKMLEAKKKLDPTRGSGHRILSEEFTLFKDFDLRKKTPLIEKFIKEHDYVDNKQLYRFCLKNELVGSEINSILNEWQQTRDDFDVFSLDGKALRTRAFHMKLSPEREIRFRFK